MLISFRGISRPVAFVDCEHLVPLCAAIMHGWDFSEACESDAEPVIVIRRKDETYVMEADWLDEPIVETSDVSAVCSFLVDLVRAYLGDNPSLLCLHCGAAEFDERLVVFPSTYRAGKSTLIARLASEGVPVYADDVLPITGEGDRGMGLGLAPRLRLPLPAAAGPAFRAFVAAHSGPSDGYYLYLDPPPETMRRHGATAPVGAFVLLERQAEGAAELVPALRSESLQHVILRNFAGFVPVEDVFARLHALVGRTPCYSLRYSDLDEAAELLKRTFGAWAPCASERPVPTEHRLATARGAVAAPTPDYRQVAPDAQYLRMPGIALQALDDALFLIDPRNQSIFHLNAIGAGLWNLLDEPTSAEDAAAAFQTAFPEMERATIQRDVTRLLADLEDADLIAPARAGRSSSMRETYSEIL